MKGNVKVIEILNEILVGELTAINQYFLHARMCKNWGYHKLADKIKAESVEEMKHASNLIDRLLFLEGVPNLQKLNKINIGETVVEQLKSDLNLEQEALKNLKKAIKICLEAEDHTSRELIEHITVTEEEHIDWIETQLKIIEDIGKENYLAEQL